MKNLMITTPIYYVNGDPHIGHAYTSVLADIISRWEKLKGNNIFFLTGTDEHGQKVEQSAKKLGITPQKLSDDISLKFKDLSLLLDLSHSYFIRTTDPQHKKGVSLLWEKLSDYIYKDQYKGWYCERDEAFYAEQELIKNKEGEKVAPTGAPIKWVEEESYFFKLSEFQKPLLDFYEKHKDFVYPESRFNEVKSFVKGGLKDLCISRSTITWGIDVPSDPAHKVYVWLDALSNYITAIDYPEGEKFKTFWPNALHIVGKDILRFHAVYWPAFLMACSIDCPEKIIAHGWWQSDGEKMSKSLGNVINPKNIIEQSNKDSLRYFFAREISIGNDGNFSFENFITRIDSDLANNYGNLVHRTLSLIKNYCNGAIPNPSSLNEKDKELMSSADKLLDLFNKDFQEHKLQQATVSIMDLLTKANQYINEMEPWNMAKNKEANQERIDTVLYSLVYVLQKSSIVLIPIIPSSAYKILFFLGSNDTENETDKISFANFQDKPEVGKALPPHEMVFKKLKSNFKEQDK